MRRRFALSALVVSLLLVVTEGHGDAKAKRRRPDSVRSEPAEDARQEDPMPQATAFVCIEGQGVFRLDATGLAPVVPTASTVRDLALDGDGGLWVSLRDSGLVRVLGKETVKVKEESFEKLAIRSRADVWAINDSHGSVVHYDGTRWKTARTRNSLRGAFEDNRLLSIVTDGRGLWVSGWNGLWRVMGGRWTRLDPPTAETTARDEEGAAVPPFPLSIAVTGKGLLACYTSACYLSATEGWQPLAWPAGTARLQAIGARDLLAGAHADGRRVVIGRIGGTDDTATSETLPVTGINDIAIDDAERIWVALGQGLVLLDAKGRVLRRWTPGREEQGIGTILRVLVVGAGPASL